MLTVVPFEYKFSIFKYRIHHLKSKIHHMYGIVPTVRHRYRIVIRWALHLPVPRPSRTLANSSRFSTNAALNDTKQHRTTQKQHKNDTKTRTVSL